MLLIHVCMSQGSNTIQRGRSSIRLGTGSWISMSSTSRPSPPWCSNIIRTPNIFKPPGESSWWNVVSAPATLRGAWFSARVHMRRARQHSSAPCIKHKLIGHTRCYLCYPRALELHWHMCGHVDHVYGINRDKSIPSCSKKTNEEERWRRCYHGTTKHIATTICRRGSIRPPTCQANFGSMYLAHWGWRCKMVC